MYTAESPVAKGLVWRTEQAWVSGHVQTAVSGTELFSYPE